MGIVLRELLEAAGVEDKSGVIIREVSFELVVKLRGLHRGGLQHDLVDHAAVHDRSRNVPP